MDFEITVDRGSALFFDADACLMFGSLSSILLLSSKEAYLLMCETVIGIVLCLL